MPRPRPRRDPCDCRDCLEGEGGDGANGAAAAAVRGVGFLDGIVAKSSSTSTSAATASSAPAPALLTGSRAARQDPPPRALLLLCDGMLPGLIAEARERGAAGEEEEEPGSSSSPLSRHLDAVARGGAVGTLALRGETKADDPRLRRHPALFQLLGAHLGALDLSPPPKDSKKKKPPTLSERFLGLSAALVTTDADAASDAGVGEGSFGGLDKVETFSISAPELAEAEAPPSSPSSSSLSAAALLASRVSVLLGIDKPMQIKDGLKEEEDGKESDDDDGSFDLVLVHLTAEAFSSGAAACDADELNASQMALSFADSFLKHVRSAPGALDDRGDDALLVAVVFSGGGGGSDGEDAGGEELPSLSLPLPPRGGAPLPLLPDGCSSFPVPRPAQSFEVAEGYRMDPGSGGRGALLVASRCDGVLRADGARRLLECKKRKKSGERSENENDNFEVLPGGNGMGCVLAEHLLDEVAYKIGRALKYGA